MNAQGKLVRTVYRDSYENGGVFLWDEMDASSPNAMLAFNAGLANGHQDFPDAVFPVIQTSALSHRLIPTVMARTANT